MKTYHCHQYKDSVPDVNRELPPLPAYTYDAQAPNGIKMSSMWSERPSADSAVLSSSPAKTDSSSSSVSKDSFRLIARQLLDSLQPAPLNVPLRSTGSKNPIFVDPSDIISNASQEVPIMLSNE